LASVLARGLERRGAKVRHGTFFDTVRVDADEAKVGAWIKAAASRRMNLRKLSPSSISIALDETTRAGDVADLLALFGEGEGAEAIARTTDAGYAAPFARTSAYLGHPVFNTHCSETEMLRYMRMLESRDLSLTHSMIPLGSCTMKLNATAEMLPVTWPQFGKLHPFAPRSQAQGYTQIFDELSAMLRALTAL